MLPLPEGNDDDIPPSGNGPEGLLPTDEIWPLGDALLSGAAEVDEEALGPWVALPQLVVKALFQPETELLALEVLAAILQQVARSPPPTRKAGPDGGAETPAADMFSSLSLASTLAGSTRHGLAIEAAVGDVESGLAVTLGAALPWVCVHLRESGSADVVAAFLEAAAGACAVVGWQDLAASVAALSSLQHTGADPGIWLPPFCVVSGGGLGCLPWPA